MDLGGTEALIAFMVVTGVAAFALYWIIRLAVKHGIEDARRHPPPYLRDRDREQSAYGDASD